MLLAEMWTDTTLGSCLLWEEASMKILLLFTILAVFHFLRYRIDLAISCGDGEMPGLFSFRD